ncbi:MAG: MBL fold metallo-hydrolase [Bacteroidota bacterium]
MNKVNLTRFTGFLLVLVFVTASGFHFYVDNRDTDLARAGVSMHYIANAGVLLSAGDQQVLIDGLHQPYRPAYRSTPPAVKTAMLEGAPPFNAIDLVLVSHIHRDHFDASDVAALLEAQPDALLISSNQVVDSLLGHGAQFSDQMQRIAYKEGAYVTIERKAVTIRAGKVAHGSARFRWIQNLGHVVEMEGLRFLHVGDPGFGRADIEKLVAELSIDVALLPSWFLSEREGRAVIDEVIQPRHLAFLHVSPGDETKLRRLANQYYPGARVLAEPLEAIHYEK